MHGFSVGRNKFLQHENAQAGFIDGRFAVEYRFCKRNRGFLNIILNSESLNLIDAVISLVMRKAALQARLIALFEIIHERRIKGNQLVVDDFLNN